MDEESRSLRNGIDIMAARLDALESGMGAVRRAWFAAVGPEIAAVTIPIAIKNGTLHVNCSSGTWASVVLHNTDTILEQLSAASSGLPPITAVKPSIGAVPPAESPTAAPELADPLPETDVAAFQSALAPSMEIVDPELRASVDRARAAAAARKQHDANH